MAFTNLDPFGQQATDVRAVQLPFVPGQVVSTTYLARMRDFINSYPQATDIWTFVVSGGTTPGSTVSVTIAGQVVTYTSTSADTTTTLLATSLAAKINGDPIVRGVASASSTGASNVVTVTGIQPGQAFVVASGTNTGTVVHSQTAATAALVPYGVAVARIAGSSTVDGPAAYVALLASTVFTAQVATMTVVYAASQRYVIGVTINGVRYESTTNADTDTATTCTAIATALNAIATLTDLVDFSGVSGTTVTATAITAGLEFAIDVAVVNAPSTNLSLVYTTGPTYLTSADRAFAGISVFAQDEELQTVGGTAAGYPANAGLRALQFGQIGVQNGDGVAYGDPVYVELDGTGLLFNSADATRALLTGQVWERNASYAAQGADAYAVVSINVTR